LVKLLALTPREKAAIEAERRKRPTVARWYPSPYEEGKSNLIRILKEAHKDESEAAKHYREMADLSAKAGFPYMFTLLESIAIQEETHAGTIKKLLFDLGETV